MAYDFDFSNIGQLTTTAMQAPTRESGSCNMCKKKGLPILPVRYSAFADTPNPPPPCTDDGGE